MDDREVVCEYLWVRVCACVCGQCGAWVCDGRGSLVDPLYGQRELVSGLARTQATQHLPEHGTAGMGALEYRPDLPVGFSHVGL